MSDTTSTQAARRPWRAATANTVAASISIAIAPAARQRAAAARVGVVEEVGGDDEPGGCLERREHCRVGGQRTGRPERAAGAVPGSAAATASS